MAIVFISPRANQKMFLKSALMILALILVIALLTFSIMVFLGKDRSDGIVPLGQKDVAINFSIIDSPEVSDLKPFYILETTFSYVVTNEADEQIQGNISSVSLEDAKATLEASGFKIVSLKEMGTGRSQPFISY